MRVLNWLMLATSTTLLCACGVDTSASSVAQSTLQKQIAQINTRMDSVSYNSSTDSSSVICSDETQSDNYIVSTTHFNVVTITDKAVSLAQAQRAAQLAEVALSDLLTLADVDSSETTLDSGKWSICVRNEANADGYSGNVVNTSGMSVTYVSDVSDDYPLMLHELARLLGENIAYVASNEAYTVDNSFARWLKEGIATDIVKQSAFYPSSTLAAYPQLPTMIDSVSDEQAVDSDNDPNPYYYTVLRAIELQGSDFSVADWFDLYRNYAAMQDSTSLESEFDSLLQAKGVDFTLSDIQSTSGYQTDIVDYIADSIDKTVAISTDREYQTFYIETGSLYAPDIQAIIDPNDDTQMIYTSVDIPDGTYALYASTASGASYGPSKVVISDGVIIADSLDLTDLASAD